jgi:hypothetical protein
LSLGKVSLAQTLSERKILKKNQREETQKRTRKPVER